MYQWLITYFNGVEFDFAQVNARTRDDALLLVQTLAYRIGVECTRARLWRLGVCEGEGK